MAKTTGKSKSLKKGERAEQEQTQQRQEIIDDSLAQPQYNLEGVAVDELGGAPLSGVTDPQVQLAKKPEVEEATIDYKSLPGAPQSDCIILGPSEAIRVEGDVRESFILVSKPVYRAFLPMGSKRWSFKLVYGAGAQIPKTTVQQIASTAPTLDGEPIGDPGQQ